MASFALWGTACETTFWPPGTFLRAYDANRRAAIDGVIETDPVATFVRQNNGQTDEVGRHGIGFAGGHRRWRTSSRTGHRRLAEKPARARWPIA